MSRIVSQTNVDRTRLGKILETTFYTSLLSYLVSHLSHPFDSPDFRLVVPFHKTFEVKSPSWTQRSLGLATSQKALSEASQKDNVFNLSNLKWFTAVLITVSHQNNLP